MKTNTGEQNQGVVSRKLVEKIINAYFIKDFNSISEDLATSNITALDAFLMGVQIDAKCKAAGAHLSWLKSTNSANQAKAKGVLKLVLDNMYPEEKVEAVKEQDNIIITPSKQTEEEKVIKDLVKSILQNANAGNTLTEDNFVLVSSLFGEQHEQLLKSLNDEIVKAGRILKLNIANETALAQKTFVQNLSELTKAVETIKLANAPTTEAEVAIETTQFVSVANPDNESHEVAHLGDVLNNTNIDQN